MWKIVACLVIHLSTTTYKNIYARVKQKNHRFGQRTKERLKGIVVVAARCPTWALYVAALWCGPWGDGVYTGIHRGHFGKVGMVHAT